MSRLWDKGAPLDARVLQYTAGEDHALDDRLVAYDVQGSIAHAIGLNAAGLLSDEDLGALRHALNEIAASHARGDWRVTLEQEDGQTAIEGLLTAKVVVFTSVDPATIKSSPHCVSIYAMRPKPCALAPAPLHRPYKTWVIGTPQ